MKKFHVFHIVTNSSYPFQSFMFTFFLTSSFIIFMKFGIFLNLTISILNILFLMFIWFKDINKESFMGKHTSEVMDGLKFGMVFFIFSEIMFFFIFFWSFFDSSLIPNMEIGMKWNPLNFKAVNPFDIPLLNTFVLLSSGIFASWTHHNILMNKNSFLTFFFTIFLGIYFTFLQLFEYSVCSFSMSDSIFGTIFFVATGFHGLHVIIGTCFLLIVFLRLNNFSLNYFHHIGLEMSLWYWHFVDVIWLFLYTFIYWWTF